VWAGGVVRGVRVAGVRVGARLAAMFPRTDVVAKQYLRLVSNCSPRRRRRPHARAHESERALAVKSRWCTAP